MQHRVWTIKNKCLYFFIFSTKNLSQCDHLNLWFHWTKLTFLIDYKKGAISLINFPLRSRSSLFHCSGLVNNRVRWSGRKFITCWWNQPINVGFIWYIFKELVQIELTLFNCNFTAISDWCWKAVKQSRAIDLKTLFSKFSNRGFSF